MLPYEKDAGIIRSVVTKPKKQEQLKMKQSQLIQIETTVRRGFPVIVSGVFVRAEPNAGFLTSGFEDLEVRTLKGRDAGFLCLTERELSELADELAAHDAREFS
jgi:hypothetical protein